MTCQLLKNKSKKIKERADKEKKENKKVIIRYQKFTFEESDRFIYHFSYRKIYEELK